MAVRTKSTSFAFSESELPVRFGRYLLLKRRNSDPVGEEFLAAWGVDEGVDQLRVVRCIYPSVAEEEHFVTYFSEEARALSRLLSANVVRVIEVDVESGIPFVACEHVEGLTLQRIIDLAKEQSTACTWELAVHIAGDHEDHVVRHVHPLVEAVQLIARHFIENILVADRRVLCRVGRMLYFQSSD